MFFLNRKILLFIAALLLLLLTQLATTGFAQQRPALIRCNNARPRSMVDNGPMLIATKYHEAAHAVATLAYGGEVNSITIFYPGSGECNCYTMDSNAMGVVYAAGFAGEKLRYPGVAPDGHQTDFDYASRSGYPAGPRVPMATDVLRKRWAAVQAIARALPDHGTLAGGTIRSLYHNALNAGSLRNQGSSGTQEAERQYHEQGQAWLQWWDNLWEEKTSPSGNTTTQPAGNQSGQARGDQRRRQRSGWDGTAADCERRGGIYNTKERSCHFQTSH